MPAPDESSGLVADLAMTKGLVTAEQAEEAFDVMAKMEELGVPEEFGRVLVKKGFISEAQLKELEARVSPKQPTMIGGYEIMSRLGRGGMGAVYKARQVSMDRLVALKVLPPVLAKDKNFIERFFREARAVARLNHPNIVQGIDVGVAEKYYYFAMEFVDGETVQSILGKGPMDEKPALAIVLQIAQALHHASRHDMIHRDVKPDNIMVTSAGVAKLCDLGLAKSLAGDSSVTQTGLAVGTPHYISPEQARGEDGVDVRADIYSLGATLYHMVAGRTPYAGSSAAVVMTKHLNDEVPNPRDERPDLSMGLVRLIEKMMAKDREDRYQVPEELIKDINLVMSGKSPGALRLATGRSAVRSPGGGVARHRGTPRTTTRPVEPVSGGGRGKIIGLLVGCAVVAILGTVLGLLLRAGDKDDDLPPPGSGHKSAKNGNTGKQDPPVGDPREEMRRQRLAGFKKELASIREYRAAQPKKFSEPAARLKRLIEVAKGTEYSLAGRQELGGLYDAQFAEAKARAKVFEDQDKFQEAYDVYNSLPLVAKLNKAAGAEQRRIKAVVLNRFKAVRRQAWKRLGPDPYTKDNRGDLKAAQGHLRTALALKMAHAIEAVNAELPKLAAEHGRRTDELEKAIAQALSAQLKELYAKFVVERDKAFLAGVELGSKSKVWKVADAEVRKRVSDALLGERFKPFSKEAKRVIRDFEASGKLMGELKARVEKKKGTRVVLQTVRGGGHEGLLVDVSDRLVGVRPRGMHAGSISQFYTSLTTNCLVELAGLDTRSAADAYLAGVFAFFIGRKSDAATFLGVAQKSPQHRDDAKYYLSFSLKAYEEEREKEAVALLDKCRKTYRQLKAAKITRGDSRWQLLRDDLQRLKEKYFDTKAVKDSLGK